MIPHGEHQIKLTVGKIRVPGKILVDRTRIWFMFPYNKLVIAEIKAMEQSKWHGFDEPNPRKVWSVANSFRNNFQLEFMMGQPVYERYDKAIPDLEMHPRFHKIKQKMIPPLGHQPRMAAHLFYRRQCILAAEMGTTKTLTAITSAEKVDNEIRPLTEDNFWYIAPKAALKAVEREFMIWGSKLRPTFMTYEKLTSVMKNWESGKMAPFVVIFDESSKVKNRQSQRSQAAKALADGMRKDWTEEPFIWLLSGSPAPKSPVDWYWLAEVARPGFLREGDEYKFKSRLAIIQQKENHITGGVYPELVAWRDDEKKCDICGKLKEDSAHDVDMALIEGLEYHQWKPSVNEVAYLYKRLQGLVLVVFKKDCLDLPEKFYRVIEVKPKQETLRAAKLIVAGAKTVISGLTRLRELSDGFQYKEVPKGKKECPRCKGTKESFEYEEIPETCESCRKGSGTDYDGNPNGCEIAGLHNPKRNQVTVSCPECGGSGEVSDYYRETVEVACPKDQVLKDLLDEHDDIGRIVIYAGFTGSIDRCVRMCHQSGWATIRVDQGAWRATNYDGNPIETEDFLSMFQDHLEKYPRVAFVAHAGSAGMGLTLTASPTILYFSNDFNAENRIQSEDRIHRPGMDVNRGATIIDILHLPTDRKVLENLQKKRELQSLTLGEFGDVLKDTDSTREV